MLGYRDDELEARWYQYGVFSPINRLHSSNSAFSGKEPWNFSMEVRSTMDDFLRLRHKLVPYLYTMNYRAWKEDTPIVVPMYYDYPETVFWGKNQAPNQYFFGSELMVTPVTTKCIPELKRAKTKVWLPEGTWFDFFNGMIYEGGRSMDLYRTLEEIPVLAKAGAIIPMTEKISALDVESNPDELTVRVYAGADNTFALYEDDNTTMAYEKDDCAKTSMTLDWGARKFTIAPVEGNQSLVPESRMYCVEFGGSTGKRSEGLCKRRGSGCRSQRERRTSYDRGNRCKTAGYRDNLSAGRYGDCKERCHDTCDGSVAARRNQLHHQRADRKSSSQSRRKGSNSGCRAAEHGTFK